MHIPEDRDLNTVTADDWRAATPDERADFITKQARRGFASFVCLSCGFPTARGQATCEACRPEEIWLAQQHLRSMLDTHK